MFPGSTSVTVTRTPPREKGSFVHRPHQRHMGPCVHIRECVLV